MTTQRFIDLRRTACAMATALIAGCAATPDMYPEDGVKPVFSFPVTSNDTPYSQCLTALREAPGDRLPAFAVGAVADKTGQINYDENGHALSQGVSEMAMSALFKTGKVRLVERFDLRVPMLERRLTTEAPVAGRASMPSVAASNFIVLGALTELNYNIVSEGAGLWINGVGAGMRTVVVNVALDLRVVKSQSLDVAYVSSLQKQIFGSEVEANVFRFFGNTLVEFDTGGIRNEPLQLGVRSVVEMAVYQIMTDFLGLPARPECNPVQTDHLSTYLKEKIR